MSASNIPKAKTPEAEQKPLAEQFESQLADARALIALAEWVEYARCLTDQVSCIAESDQAFVERLRIADVRVNSASFELHHSTGLIALLSAVDAKLVEIQGGPATLNSA